MFFWDLEFVAEGIMNYEFGIMNCIIKVRYRVFMMMRCCVVMRCGSMWLRVWVVLSSGTLDLLSANS